MSSIDAEPLFLREKGRGEGGRTPTPRRGEILGRIKAASLNYQDLAISVSETPPAPTENDPKQTKDLVLKFP